MADKREKPTNQSTAFDAIKIGLASPEQIREWSHGEVKKPETINYRTLKPEKDGLFCEKIFGPTKDWECHCGKYKKIRYKGVVCDRCGVEVTKASVRRERMGHIELAAPVSHIWYFKGIPSRMGLILDLSPRVLERVLYFASYIVLDPKDTPLHKKDVLSEAEYQQYVEQYGEGSFRAGMGAEAIQELLKEIDLDKDAEELTEELKNASGQKQARIMKRLEVVEAFRESGNKPEWMILNVLPVIPPDLRPMVQLDGGRFATSDLNDLYRRIINRNNRLRRLLELAAPDIIIRNEKRMLQEAVDALIDNGRRGRAVTGAGNRALKSLSDMLKGKNGRFRQNLLGKRVDYSGRSVIVIGPDLKMYQCGLPKEMAIELFKPFVMKELQTQGIALNIKNAKRMVEKQDDPRVWDVLEDVIKEHPVMLNRAPTLHRLGIQAFEPILVEGKAIRLHPMVCAAFNADFDGDQMAAHLPLTQEAQAECRFMLLSPNNLLKPSDGGVVAVPGQDIVLGIYYMTQERPGSLGEGKAFKNYNEALLAHENGGLDYHARIKVRMTRTMPDGTVVSGLVESTLGHFMLNEIIPQDLGFVDRSIPGNELLLETYELAKAREVRDKKKDDNDAKKNNTVNTKRYLHAIKKGDLKAILEKVMNIHGATKTAEVLDDIKAMGYKYCTLSALSVSISDMTVPAQKQELISDAESKVDYIRKEYRKGKMTDGERYKQVIDIWRKMDKTLTQDLLNGLDDYNEIHMMADSGARGSDSQIKQLAGMKGLMADTTGHTIEMPIKSNYREGLDVLEYFMSAHGARKGMSDTALRTADSGYLTRRMVDVSQELIIKEQDCNEGRNRDIPGKYVYIFERKAENGGDPQLIESLKDRITGRFSCETICDADGNVIVKANHMITPKRAENIVKNGVDANGNKIEKVKIRTILTCRCKNGICAKCYGANMATGQPVQVGEAVGIIAAQSIGEPGTQLTMRTFHTGGVAGNDITQGLPRVEELFEARKPKGMATITAIDGTVHFKTEEKKGQEIDVVSDASSDNDGDAVVKTYPITYGSHIIVEEGQKVKAGDPLTAGSINPHDLLEVKGIDAVQDYILKEVQSVYRGQGVDIADKHIEVIVRQMMKKVRVTASGESKFLPGSQVDFLDFEDENEALEAEGKEQATGERVLLGITKAALATDSFLSAASFQETTKVLTDAAIKGKIDHLQGLKENVIIGKLIPAGTGMKRYRDIKLNTDYTTKISDIVDDTPVVAEETEEADDKVDF